MKQRKTYVEFRVGVFEQIFDPRKGDLNKIFQNFKCLGGYLVGGGGGVGGDVEALN